MRSRTDYRDFYGRMKDLPLAVSRETGTLLYMLARGCGARTIMEFGTSLGISTLAAALRDNAAAASSPASSSPQRWRAPGPI
jgi:predicted O-methyltransferase YrrM